MREIQASTITDVVEKLCIEANYHLPEDVKCAITGCRACEDGEIAKGVLDKIVENYEIADAQNVPICQDTVPTAACTEWHVFSWKSDRMCTSQEEILQRQSTKVSEEDMTKDT